MENKELIQKLIKDLYKYAFGRLNSKEQAEDVTSETIARLVSKMQKESLTPEQIRMVSFGIAKNVLFEKYREETKINHDELNEELDITDQESLEEVVMKDEMIELIKSELNTLDKTTKDILILKIWEDLKFTEIAELNNSNENTIKTIYYKGLSALKKQLEVKHGTKAYSFTIPSIILGLSLYSDSVAAQIPATFLAGTLASVPASLFIMFSNMANPVIAAGSTAVGASQKGLVSKFISTTIGKIVIGGVATTVAVGTGVGGAVLVKNNIDNTNNLEPISYVQSDYDLVQEEDIDTITQESNTKVITFCIDNYTEATPNCLTEITAPIPKDAVITTPVTEGAGPAPKSGVAKITGNGFNFLIVAPYESFEQEFAEVTEIKEGIFRVKSKSSLENGFAYSSDKDLKTKSSCQLFENTLNYPCGVTIVDYSEAVGLTLSCDASSDVKICDAIVKSLKVKVKTPNMKTVSVILDGTRYFQGTTKTKYTFTVPASASINSIEDEIIYPLPNNPADSLESTLFFEIKDETFSLKGVLPYESFAQVFSSVQEIGSISNVGKVFRMVYAPNGANIYNYSNGPELSNGSNCQRMDEIISYPCGLMLIKLTPDKNNAINLSCEEKSSGGLNKCEEIIKTMKYEIIQ